VGSLGEEWSVWSDDAETAETLWWMVLNQSARLVTKDPAIGSLHLTMRVVTSLTAGIARPANAGKDPQRGSRVQRRVPRILTGFGDPGIRCP